MTRPLRHLAVLAIWAPAWLATAAPAGASGVERVMGVTWQSPADLSALVGDGARLRFATAGVALLALPAGVAADAGDALLFVDTPGPDQAYYLSDQVHFGAGQPPPRGPGLVTTVYQDPRGWSLVRLPQAHLVEVLETARSLYPLPRSYPLPAPPAARKRLVRPASPQVQALLAQVDTARLRNDVEDLSFFDPTLGAVAGNVRTRYARRPETLDSAELLRSWLGDILGPQAARLDSFRIAPGDSLMVNVIGDLPGTDPEAGYWIVCGHYDAIGTRTRPSDMARIGETDRAWDWRRHPAPGADDNGTGVALVLESARLLSQRRFPWGVRFIAWSGEELGLWGSKHYAEAAADRGDHILGVFNVDMVGFNDLVDRVEMVTNPQSRWIVDLMAATAERYDLGLEIDILQDAFAGLSDHQPFWAAGYDAVLGIENYLPTDSLSAGVREGRYRINTQYHTVADLPDSVNWELVARVTRLTVATLAQFGAEEGLPNLAVFEGDVRSGPEGLEVDVVNVGPAQVAAGYDVRVSRCAADSSDCEVIYAGSQTGPLAPGDVARISVPWPGLGSTLFLVEVDPGNRVSEEVETDNRRFLQVSLVPRDGLVVYPNPFRPTRDGFLRFSGVPRFSRLRLYSVTGDLVWTEREEDQAQEGEIHWPGTNATGFAVSPGIYYYHLRSFAGKELERGKVAVVR